MISRRRSVLGGNLNGWWSHRLDNESTKNLQAYYGSDSQICSEHPTAAKRAGAAHTYDIQGQQK